MCPKIITDSVTEEIEEPASEPAVESIVMSVDETSGEIVAETVVEEIDEPVEAVESVDEFEPAVTEPAEELEELDDLLPADNQFFSMTGFGSGNAVLEELKDEETETANSQVFIETEGVCSISEKVDYSGVVQDMNFKALVDSVLNQN